MKKYKKDNNRSNIFLKEMADIRRLPNDYVEPFKKRYQPISSIARFLENNKDIFIESKIEIPDFLEFMRPGIQYLLFRKLKRGLIPPEVSIDLHGMRVIEARKAYLNFLHQSLRSKIRIIKIIHGKGQAILKEKVYYWLIQMEEVLAFVSASKKDGGTGAVYVLLSNK